MMAKPQVLWSQQVVEEGGSSRHQIIEKSEPQGAEMLTRRTLWRVRGTKVKSLNKFLGRRMV